MINSVQFFFFIERVSKRVFFELSDPAKLLKYFTTELPTGELKYLLKKIICNVRNSMYSQQNFIAMLQSYKCNLCIFFVFNFAALASNTVYNYNEYLILLILKFDN